MSANINISNPDKPRRIAMIAANPTVSKQTGWPIGFWWAELTHPWWAFSEAGYKVDIFSPDGGKLEADGFSDPEHESGYSAHDILSLGFKKSAEHSKLVENSKPISQIRLADYDGIFLCGGQSPMYTFIENAPLHKLVVDFYEAGKIVGIVCHATCVLLKAKTKEGNLLVNEKTWTGFADAEEQYADQYVGQKIQPFWIESEARKLPDTTFITGGIFRPFAIRDGNLVTGQQQFSGAEAAKLMIEALGR